MAEEFWLSDGQWERLAPLLPNKPRGVPRVDDRRVISGIIHVLKSGGRWADAPSSYGPRKTLYNRFVRWAAKGVWSDLFEVLARLDKASGAEWDRIFLNAMIRHHEGAIKMVDDLFASYGALQDDDVYKFASDMYADQSIEIERMEKMLDGPAKRRP